MKVEHEAPVRKPARVRKRHLRDPRDPPRECGYIVRWFDTSGTIAPDHAPHDVDKELHVHADSFMNVPRDRDLGAGVRVGWRVSYERVDDECPWALDVRRECPHVQ